MFHARHGNQTELKGLCSPFTQIFCSFGCKWQFALVCQVIPLARRDLTYFVVIHRMCCVEFMFSLVIFCPVLRHIELRGPLQHVLCKQTVGSTAEIFGTKPN